MLGPFSIGPSGPDTGSWLVQTLSSLAVNLHRTWCMWNRTQQPPTPVPEDLRTEGYGPTLLLTLTVLHSHIWCQFERKLAPWLGESRSTHHLGCSPSWLSEKVAGTSEAGWGLLMAEGLWLPFPSLQIPSNRGVLSGLCRGGLHYNQL